MKPELNRLYCAEDLDPSWLWVFGSRFYQFPVPTETVVLEPRHVTPIMGRVWLGTGFYLYDDEIMGSDELRERAIEKTGKFGGTSAGDSLYLSEVYAEQGSDGHTDYNLVGYRFVTASVAGPKLENATFAPADEWRKASRPTGFMFSEWHDDDYDRRREAYDRRRR